MFLRLRRIDITSKMDVIKLIFCKMNLRTAFYTKRYSQKTIRVFYFIQAIECDLTGPINWYYLKICSPVRSAFFSVLMMAFLGFFDAVFFIAVLVFFYAGTSAIARDFVFVLLPSVRITIHLQRWSDVACSYGIYSSVLFRR